MARIKALCLAGVASFAVTASAFAADLPLPAPPVFEPPPAPVAFGGAWYIRGDAGLGIADLRQGNSDNDYVIPGLAYNSHTLEDSAFIDAGVGYRFNEYFRADVTGEYRGSAHYQGVESYSGGGATGYDNYSASVRSIVGLVNGYVDLGCWYGVTPFVGAGVGVANVAVRGLTDNGAYPFPGYGLAGDHSQTNFAFALMAGLDFAITQNLTMELGYRYLNQGSVRSGAIQCQNISPDQCSHEVQHYKIASNDIRLGFRYAFSDFAPRQRAPIIARY